MKKKYYSVNCDDINGLTIYGEAGNEADWGREIPDWLPDFVQEKMANTESGSLTYYEQGGNQYETKQEVEEFYPRLTKTVVVEWNGAKCSTHEVGEYGECESFTHDGIYAYEEIIDMAGHVGVPVRFGAVENTALSEGLHVVNPFTTRVHKIDIQTQLAQVSADASTKDLQEVTATVAVNFSVSGEESPKLYQTVGELYYERVVLPVVQETFKAHSATYNAEELITKRVELSTALNESLKTALAKRGIIVEGVSILQFSFSKRFNDAVEAKIVAEQEALQAKNELEKVKVEAQKAEETAIGKAMARKAEAEGEAEAIKVKAVAEAEAITTVSNALQENQNVLFYQGIQKWDGTLPTHIFGNPQQVIDVTK